MFCATDCLEPKAGQLAAFWQLGGNVQLVAQKKKKLGSMSRKVLGTHSHGSAHPFVGSHEIVGQEVVRAIWTRAAKYGCIEEEEEKNQLGSLMTQDGRSARADPSALRRGPRQNYKMINELCAS